ncbi:MAG: hypothetical protein KBA52_01545 [Candidatus Kapabacteria bacterium]|nr:hypothetical protein [Candidatus Kapabacteria bacterium]
MFKKQYSTISFLTILIIAAMTVVLSSCTNDDPVSPENEYPNMPEYVSGGIYVDELTIINISIESPAYIDVDMDPKKIESGLLFCKVGPQYHFRPIFRKLHLTQDQLILINQFMMEHYSCQRNARMQYYDTVLKYVDFANAKRSLLLDSLSTGMVDSSYAGLRLTQINTEMWRAIENSNARAILITNLTECVDVLMVNVNLVLTEKQKDKWEKWLFHHKKYHPGNGIGWGLVKYWDD